MTKPAHYTPIIFTFLKILSNSSPGLPWVWKQYLQYLLNAVWLSCEDLSFGELLLNGNDSHRAERLKWCQNT